MFGDDIIWNIFDVNSNNISSTNLGLPGQIGGFSTESLAGLGLTGTILGYNIKNYDINKRNLDINAKNLEISKLILEINKHIRDITDEHLDVDILQDISTSLRTLNEQMKENNNLLKDLKISINNSHI